MTDLTTQTPVEIDTVLAEIYGRLYVQRAKAHQALETLDSYAKAVVRNAEHAVKGASTRWMALSYITQSDVEKAAARLTEEQAKADAIYAETLPFRAEFTRRGGWTRAYLVDNTNGHVHNSTNCSTCFPTTVFGWLPEYSGHDEAEVVADAGEQACTVCFPTAPCVGKSKIELPAKRAARIEREAAKAERHAKKVAKALFADDIDKTIKVNSLDCIGTIASAKSFLTNGAEYNWDHPYYLVENRDLVASLLAERLGTTPEAEVAAAHKRAQKRR